MLGKHVNVSAKNRKLMHKVLCVILAIVLIGLMVPHGLAAQLSAYAGNEAEQTPAAETQADNSQESTPAEEVNTPEAQAPAAAPIPSNEGEPTNDEFTVVIDLGTSGVYFDDTEILTDAWTVTSQDEAAHATGLKYTGDTTGSPTYASVLEQLDRYCYGGNYHDHIGGTAIVADTTDLVTFAYDDTTIDINDPITAGEYVASPQIGTYITINNDSTVTDLEGAELHYSYLGKTDETYIGWPSNPNVLYLKSGAEYSIESSGKLKSTVIQNHRVSSGYFSWCESTSHDFTGFSATASTGTIAPGLTFTANWTLKDRQVTFYCHDKSGEGINDAKFMVNGTEQTSAEKNPWFSDVPQPAYFINNNGVIEFYSAAEGGSLIKTFTFNFDASQPYSIVNWEYEDDSAQWRDVPTDHRETLDDKSGAFTATCNQDVIIDYNAYKKGTTEAIEGLTLQKSSDGSMWETVTGSERFADDTMISYDNDKKLLMLNGWMYRYVFPTGEEVKYTPEGWFNITGEEGSETHIPISGTEVALSTLGYNLNLAAEYTENVKVTFNLNNNDQSEFTISYGSTEGQKLVEFYCEPGTTYEVTADETTVTIDNVDYKLVHGGKISQAYQFNSLFIDPTPSTEGTISEDITFTFRIDTKVSFVVDPAGAGSVVDVNGDTITEIWGDPAGTIVQSASDVKELTITNYDDPVTVFAKEDPNAYAFGSWTFTSPIGTALNTTIKATFVELPVVQFEKVGEEADTEILTLYETTSLGKHALPSVVHFAAGSQYTVDANGALKIVDSRDVPEPLKTRTYTGEGDNHTVAFGGWYTDEDCTIPATTGTVPDEGGLTFYAKAESIDDWTSDITFVKGDEQHSPMYGHGFADIIWVDGTEETYKKTVNFVITEADPVYTLSDIPSNAKVYVAGYVDGYITESGSINVTTEQPSDITLTFQTSAWHFYPADYSDSSWTHEYGKTLTGTNVSATTDSVNVTNGGSFTVLTKKGDKLNFVDNSADAYSNPYILSYTYNGTTKTTSFVRQGYVYVDESFTAASTEIEMTITFTGGSTPKAISSLDVYNSPRSISYIAYDGAAEGKSGRGTGTFEGPNAAYMDTEFAYNATAGTLTIDETVVQNHPTQTAHSTESMWRGWVFEAGEATSGHIVKDTTFTGKFVLAWINVQFAAKTGDDYFNPDVTFNPEFTTNFEIHMDSVFNNIATGDTLKAKAGFDFTDANKTMEITIASETVKLKFDTPAFDNPIEGDKINELLQDSIETNPYVITYKVIERTPVNIKANLDDGVFVSPYALPAIDPSIGGKGAWTPDENNVWCNTVYEEYPVSTLKEATINTTKWDNVFKFDGFFKGWNWAGTGSEPTKATADQDLEYLADYEAAVWIGGTVTDSSDKKAPISGAEIRFTTEAEKGLDPSGEKTLKAFTDNTGKFTKPTTYVAKETPGRGIQVYIGSAGELTAGGQGYIQDEMNLTSTDLQVDKLACDFELDKGYSFFAVDYDKAPWYARYYEKKDGNPRIGIRNVTRPVGGFITLDDDSNQFLSMDDGSSHLPMNSGDEIIISTNTLGSSLNVETKVAQSEGDYRAKEDVEITSDELVYTVWGTGSDMWFRKTPGEEPVKISRIDYRIPWEEYISIHGKVTDNAATPEKLDGIEVSYTPPAGSNALVTSKTTFDGGNYYLIIPQYASGKVMFVDPWNDHEKDDHLDERIRLADDGTDTESDITTQAASSGDTANPAMIPAIHVEGNVEQVVSEKGVTPPVYGPAKGVKVSYSLEHDPGANYDYEWNEGNHGYAVTGSDGDYTMKLAKSDEVEGGFVWFYLDNQHAQDGHKLMKNGKLLPHNEDIDEINGQIDYVGAYVQITPDEWATVDHFDIITYYQGTEIDRYAADYDIDTKGMFSDQGVFRTAYDEAGEHVLEYYVGDPDDFRITVQPIIKEHFTYWAWKLKDYKSKEVKTLNDIETISLESGNNEPYIFTLYTTDSAVLTASGTSEGHAMWDAKVTVTSGEEQKSITEEMQVPAGTDFVREFPLCNHELANEVEEKIHTEYFFDGENFNLVISSEFGEAKVPYEEHWVLDPVAAEGYYFAGMSMNNAEMVAGDVIELAKPVTELNLVAHYLPIPEDVGAQTGDDNSMWWLVGLAILAMAGVAYGASRKQKGIRR